jgi:hypothetical protein
MALRARFSLTNAVGTDRAQGAPPTKLEREGSLLDESKQKGRPNRLGREGAQPS